MRDEIGKYFWDLNKKAIRQTKKILKSPLHAKYVLRAFTLLSRMDEPKKLFSVINKEQFIQTWPDIRRYWKKIGQAPDFLAWWDTIYTNILEKKGMRQRQKGKPARILLQIGEMIKKARIEKGLSQLQLAAQVGMMQPHISSLEKGEKNVTLETLIRVCRVLGIKKILI